MSSNHCLNKVILIGNLGGAPERRQTASGQAVTNFNVATSHRYQKGEEWVEETEWTRVVSWGRTADVCAEYLDKGKSVFVEGRLQTRRWEDKEKNTHYATEVVAERVIFLSKREPAIGGHEDSPVPRGHGRVGGASDPIPEANPLEDMPF